MVNLEVRGSFIVLTVFGKFGAKIRNMFEKSLKYEPNTSGFSL